MRRKRYTILAVLVVCALPIWQLLCTGAISPWCLPTVVALAGLIGGYCGCVAALGVVCRHKRFRVMKKEMRFPGDAVHDTRQNRAEACRLVCRSLSVCNGVQGLKDYSPQSGSDVRLHFEERLLYLMQPLLKSDGKDESLPSLSDLEQLTVLAEMRRPSVSLLNILNASLLILGIFGTLYGIHFSLDSTSALHDLKLLDNALMPGMLAVAFTVVLGIIKGIYLCLFRRYLYDINTYTIGVLYPKLAIDTQVDNYFAAVSDCITRLDNSLSAVRVSVDALQNTGSALSGTVRVLNARLQQIHGIADSISAAFTHCIDTCARHEHARRILNRAVSDLADQQAALQKTVRSAAGLCVLYDRTLRAVGQSAQKCTEHAETWQLPVAADAAQLDACVASLLETRDMSGRLAAHLSHLRTIRSAAMLLLKQTDDRRATLGQLVDNSRQVQLKLQYAAHMSNSLFDSVDTLFMQMRGIVSEMDPKNIIAGLQKLSLNMQDNAELLQSYSAVLQSAAQRYQQPLFSRYEKLAVIFIFALTVVKIIFL